MQNNNSELKYDNFTEVLNDFKDGFGDRSGNLDDNDFLRDLATKATVNSLGINLDRQYSVEETRNAAVNIINQCSLASSSKDKPDDGSYFNSNAKVAVFVAFARNFGINFTKQDLKSLLQEKEYLLDKYPINEMLNDDKIKNLIREDEPKKNRTIKLKDLKSGGSSEKYRAVKDDPYAGF